MKSLYDIFQKCLKKKTKNTQNENEIEKTTKNDQIRGDLKNF